jgi:hypothetical protein
LNDEILSAVLDGDAAPGVLAHLEDCADCAARLAAARRFDSALTLRLHRWDCPPAQRLGDYHIGLLSLTEQRTLAKHLELCAACSAEIEELRVFLVEEAPAPVRETRPAIMQTERPSRLRTLVAQLLPRTPSFAMAAVRGAGDGPIIAQSSAATVILEAQPAGEQQVRLTGQLADELGDQERWDGALVEVRQAGTLIATAFVDDVGGFTCAPLPSAATELRISGGDGTSIKIEQIDL